MTPIDRAREAAVEAVRWSDAEYNPEYIVRDAIAAYEAALAAEGMVLVPKTASEGMLRAAIQAEVDHYKPPQGSTYRVRSIMEIHKLWSAMIAAASQGEKG